MMTFDEAPEPNRALGPYAAKAAEQIAIAERAFSIWRTVGLHAEQVNKANFGDLFGSLQGALSDQFVLSVAKLCETPSSRYTILSLPALADTVERLSASLLMENHYRVRRYLAAPDSLSQETSAEASFANNRLIAAHIRSVLPQLAPDRERDSDRVLDAVKYRRDKVIAHNEHLGDTPLPRLTWEEGQSLLEIAKSILGLLGWGYLRTAFEDDTGEYLLTSDAERGGRALERLLQHAGLAPKRDYGAVEPPRAS